jgi:hypothetical protein
VKTSPLAVAFPSKPGPYQLLTTGSASAFPGDRAIDATMDATVAPAASVAFVVGFIYVPPDSVFTTSCRGYHHIKQCQGITKCFYYVTECVINEI